MSAWAISMHMIDSVFSGWLCQDKRDANKAYCRWCRSSLKSSTAILHNHRRSMKHFNNRIRRVQKHTINLINQRINQSSPVQRNNQEASSASIAVDPVIEEDDVVIIEGDDKLKTPDLRLLLCSDDN